MKEKMTTQEIEKIVDENIHKPIFVIELGYTSGNVIAGAFTKFSYDNGNYEWAFAASCVTDKVRARMKGDGYNVPLSEDFIRLNPDKIEYITQITSFMQVSEIISREELLAELVRVNGLL